MQEAAGLALSTLSPYLERYNRLVTGSAAELGYAVTLISDAHSTFDGDEKTAAEIIREHNSELAQFAWVKLTDTTLQTI
ncbi:MAG: hypothetical protein ACI85U_003789 [Candidatus Promineifilaceae bacterium]|jgi:hypothetical protein